MSTVEGRYRRLLALYPKEHRERYGEEMIGVLLADSKGRSRLANTLNLVTGAVRVRARRVRTADTAHLSDALAMIGVLAPVLMIAGIDTDAHEVAWFVWYGGFSGVPWTEAVPDAPVWLAWVPVAVFALCGLRRTAMIASWLAGAAFLAGVVVPNAHLNGTLSAGWALLAMLAVVALTCALLRTRQDVSTI